jgi:predicted RNase H-like nuclease (RuvC/YqgF family)
MKTIGFRISDELEKARSQFYANNTDRFATQTEVNTFLLKTGLDNLANPQAKDANTKLLVENIALKKRVNELQKQIDGLNKLNDMRSPPGEQLANLQQENDNLKTEVNAKSIKITELEAVDNETLSTAKALVTELQTEVKTLKANPQTTAKLASNQVIVVIPPSLQPFLVELAVVETRKVGHKVTIANMLLQLMWRQIKIGSGDHLPITYSNSQIKNILETVKKEMQDG